MTYLDCMNHLTEKKLGLVTTTRHQSPFICDLCSFMSSEVLNEAFDSDVIVTTITITITITITVLPCMTSFQDINHH